jgi:hypothetical protein
MDTDLAATMAGLTAAKTQTLAQYAIIKKQHQMEMSLIDMLATAARSAPPATGTGLVVDKSA